MLIILEAIKEMIGGISVEAEYTNPIVFALPSYYTNDQVEILRELCQCLKITKVNFIPDFLASALSFGYYNNPSYYDRPNINTLVLILDMGYLSFSATLIGYKLDNCDIISHYSNTHIGGRVIDEILINYISNLIKDKYNTDPLKNPKLYLKIKQSVISCKEKLSATGASSVLLTVDDIKSEKNKNINSENDDDDDDDTFETVLDIVTLNMLIDKNKILESIHSVIEKTFEAGFVSNEQKSNIEFVMLGGSNRIPYIQQSIQKWYNKDRLNFTLNMDESVSFGCAYYEAILLNLWNYKYKSPFSFNKCNHSKAFLQKTDVYYKTILQTQIALSQTRIENQQQSHLTNELESRVYEIERTIDSLSADQKHQFLELKNRILSDIKFKSLSQNDVDDFNEELDDIVSVLLL